MKDYVAVITIDGTTTDRTVKGSAKNVRDFHKDTMRGLDWGSEEILDIFEQDGGKCVFRLKKGFFE